MPFVLLMWLLAGFWPDGGLMDIPTPDAAAAVETGNARVFDGPDGTPPPPPKP